MHSVRSAGQYELSTHIRLTDVNNVLIGNKIMLSEGAMPQTFNIIPSSLSQFKVDPG